ncbi:MAG: DUF448 domain-containing protein [Candidatus Binatia bacterium]
MGCGTAASAPELVRIVADADGELRVDRGLRAGGRGGYLHAAQGCLAQFARRKGPVRSLRITADRAARDALVAKVLAVTSVGE